jgi:hypothetical protein
MIKNLTIHGNSYAIILDKPIQDLLGATSETSFEVITDGRWLVLTPIRDPEAERSIRMRWRWCTSGLANQ